MGSNPTSDKTFKGNLTQFSYAIDVKNESRADNIGFSSVVVITLASHARGPGFEPRLNLDFILGVCLIYNKVCSSAVLVLHNRAEAHIQIPPGTNSGFYTCHYYQGGIRSQETHLQRRYYCLSLTHSKIMWAWRWFCRDQDSNLGCRGHNAKY